MLIKCLPVGHLMTNCYIVTDETTLECAVIDPGDESNTILYYLEDNHLTCRAILLTHGHYDHTGAVYAVHEETGAPVYMNALDAGTAVAFDSYTFTPPEGTIFYKEGDEVKVGNLTFRVMETPGHTPGGVTLICGDALFTGDTLSRHEHTLLELAKRQHLNVTDIYREVVSGDTIAARPMMQRVLSEVEQGVWSGVLVMEVERLARGDTIDQGIIAQTFKFSGTKIITPIKTYDPDNEFDEEYFEFGLFMSRREYKIINRRLQRGRLASAKEGKWPSGLAPFGYRRVKLKNEKGCSLEPIEEQAAIVRMIFDLYTVGLQDEDGSARPLSLGSIATRLNDMRIPSPSGSQWARITIRGIIKNPTYIGMVRWGSRETKKKVVDGKVVSVHGPADPEKECVFKGIHPPLIPKETFELANDKLTRSENTSTRKEKVVRNPLAGLLVCSECGRQMMRMINPVHPDMPVVRCPRRGCPNCSSYLPIVEERVIQGLSEWMKGYELEWSSAAASSSE